MAAHQETYHAWTYRWSWLLTHDCRAKIPWLIGHCLPGCRNNTGHQAQIIFLMYLFQNGSRHPVIRTLRTVWQSSGWLGHIHHPELASHWHDRRFCTQVTESPKHTHTHSRTQQPEQMWQGEIFFKRCSVMIADAALQTSTFLRCKQWRETLCWKKATPVHTASFAGMLGDYRPSPSFIVGSTDESAHQRHGAFVLNSSLNYMTWQNSTVKSAECTPKYTMCSQKLLTSTWSKWTGSLRKLHLSGSRPYIQ